MISLVCLYIYIYIILYMCMHIYFRRLAGFEVPG